MAITSAILETEIVCITKSTNPQPLHHPMAHCHCSEKTVHFSHHRPVICRTQRTSQPAANPLTILTKQPQTDCEIILIHLLKDSLVVDVILIVFLINLQFCFELV